MCANRGAFSLVSSATSSIVRFRGDGLSQAVVAQQVGVNRSLVVHLEKRVKLGGLEPLLEAHHLSRGSRHISSARPHAHTMLMDGLGGAVFCDLTLDCVRNGSLGSLKGLCAEVETYPQGCNVNPVHSNWSAEEAEILAKIKHAREASVSNL